MSQSQTPQQKGIDTEDTLFERSGSEYGYIGEDSAGRHHHLDERTQTIYVTDSTYEQFERQGRLAYWYRVSGTVHHTEALGQYDTSVLEAWKAHVENVCGWEECLESPVASVANALSEGN